MYSYTATIGRNYRNSFDLVPEFRGQPMTLSAWSRFAKDVIEEFRVTIEKTRETDGYTWDEDTEFRIEAHYGKGTWDGIEEESAKISVLSDKPLTHLNYLRQALTHLAEEYGQDAITLTIGESELC